ncbi:MAG: tetratricopeptide repeat protein [Verrucomicrobiota bacterium]
MKNRAGRTALPQGPAGAVFRGWICVLAALALLVAGCSPSGPGMLKRGIRLIEQGKYSEAVEQLRLSTASLGTNALAWQYLGLAYQLSGEATNAVRAYQYALTLNHDLAEAHYNLGCLWLDQNKPDAARAELITFTALRKNSPDGWLKLGTAQLRMADAEPRSNKPAALSARAAELAAAQASFDEALRLSPQNPEALNGLGLIQLQRNRPHEAALCFSAALKRQPNYAPALLNLAIVAQEYLDDRRLALQKYKEYLAQPISAAEAAPVAALVRSLEQESPAPAGSTPAKPAAPRHSETAVQKTAGAPAKPEPERPAPPAGPSSVPVAAPTDTAASKPAATAEPAAAEKPGFFSRLNPTRWFGGGSKPAAAGGAVVRVNLDSDVAAQLKPYPRYRFNELGSHAPGDAAGAARLFASGLQAQQAGKFSEAAADYSKAAKLDPSNFDAFYNQGIVATAAGDLPQALLAYENALALRPDSADARYNFALTLKQANYLADAVEQLTWMTGQFPSDVRGHLALGNICVQQLNLPKRARVHYARVIEIAPRNPQAPAIRDWLVAHPG